MRILFSSLVAATILVAAGAVGWKAEAAMTTGVGTLPLQTKSYTPTEKVAYRHRYARRHYRRYAVAITATANLIIGPMVLSAISAAYGYYGYGWRPGISIYVGPGWGY